MEIKVIGFGSISDVVPEKMFDVKEKCTVGELIRILSQKYPVLVRTKFAVAVDEKIIRKETKLKDGSEVALLPPFAGG